MFKNIFLCFLKEIWRKKQTFSFLCSFLVYARTFENARTQRSQKEKNLNYIRIIFARENAESIKKGP